MSNRLISHNLFTNTVEDELGSVLDDIPDAWRKGRDHPGHACHLLEVSIPAMDAFNMLWKNFILGTAGLELVRRIDDEHLVTALLGFALAKDQDAGSKAGALEEIRAEIGRGFENPCSRSSFGSDPLWPCERGRCVAALQPSGPWPAPWT